MQTSTPRCLHMPAYIYWHISEIQIAGARSWPHPRALQDAARRSSSQPALVQAPVHEAVPARDEGVGELRAAPLAPARAVADQHPAAHHRGVGAVVAFLARAQQPQRDAGLAHAAQLELEVAAGAVAAGEAAVGLEVA